MERENIWKENILISIEILFVSDAWIFAISDADHDAVG